VPAQTVRSDKSPSQILCLSQSSGPNAKAAQDQIPHIFGDTLKKITARTCRRYSLQKQELEDVLAETFHQLFNPGIVRFSAHRGIPASYLKGLAQNAARKVLTQLGKRRRNDDGSSVKRYRSPSSIPSPAENTEVRDTVDFIMAQATPRIRRALELCYWEDWPLQSIAEDLGMSRFALRRELNAFFEAMKKRLGGN
jgi:RNA polymerase sigma factor (sigma-70 family)